MSLNAIINLCLALRQWVGRRDRKEGFKPRPTYATVILSNGSYPKHGLIHRENGFREHLAAVNGATFDYRAVVKQSNRPEGLTVLELQDIWSIEIRKYCTQWSSGITYCGEKISYYVLL
ncbi:hypothetical protein KM043_016557 [Ampulex compressa]|nr:hypothetical protein KM043_016557 [Ampulex compressa]